MGSQVAVAEVAVVPTFKGFRKLVTNETDSSARAGAQGFSRAFAKTGTDSGRQVGTGFKKAFEQSAQGSSDKVTKALEADVAKASRALSAARLKEQDAIGKQRVAQAQLNEATGKYAADSSQVIRAQERLATASRQLGTAHEGTERATDDLKRSQGELARAADRAGDELSEAGRKGIGGFRENVTGGVKSFAGPLVAAFAALGIGNIVADAFNEAKDFVLESVDIASDVNESVNAVQVSYGAAADEVLKLGQNSAKAFGLSRNDLNAYATQFSAFVNTIAGANGDVAGTLAELVGRGTDFASVFNIDVSEALQTFQSGLAGETEPLRKFGIDLSAATVEQYAYANGIAAAGTELTEAQKVQARYGALMQQTNKVAGDFVNTSDQLANKNRINAAEWENVQAKLGEGFLPVAQELATILGDDVIPVIADLAEKHGPELAEAFADVLPELTDLAEDLLPQLPGLIQSFVDALPGAIALLKLTADVLIPVVEGVNGLLAGQTAVNEFLSGDTSLTDYRDKIADIPGPLGELLRGVENLRDGFRIISILAPLYWELVKLGVKTKIDEIITFIKEIPSRALTALGDLRDDLVQSGKDLIGGFLRGMQQTPIGSIMSGIMREVQGYFPHSPAKTGPFSGSGWTQLAKSGEAFWDQWTSGMGGGDDLPFPSFGDLGGGGGYLPSTGAQAPAGAKTVNQYNTFQNIDPRHAIRELGREAERAFAAS